MEHKIKQEETTCFDEKLLISEMMDNVAKLALCARAKNGVPVGLAHLCPRDCVP